MAWYAVTVLMMESITTTSEVENRTNWNTFRLQKALCKNSETETVKYFGFPKTEFNSLPVNAP